MVFQEISRNSSGFSNFKSTKNTNLGLDLHSKAPNLLIFSGNSPRLGGTIFVWGGTSSQLGGTAPVCPPVAPGLNQLNHVALPISMPRFKSIIFIKIAPKLGYICKKMQNFRALGAPPPDPRASGGWELCPHALKTTPHCEFLAMRLNMVSKRN